MYLVGIIEQKLSFVCSTYHIAVGPVQQRLVKVVVPVVYLQAEIRLLPFYVTRKLFWFTFELFQVVSGGLASRTLKDAFRVGGESIDEFVLIRIVSDFSEGAYVKPVVGYPGVKISI